MSYTAFFQPPDGWVGDVIPLETDGLVRLYYLLERREAPHPGTPWALATTKDFASFDDAGTAFANGSAADPDRNVYTGSVVLDQQRVAHLFYTAQNPQRLGRDDLPLQTIRRARSTDGLATWDRDADWELEAPEGFESADWRDPFVLWDDEAGLWRMLVAARHVDGPDRRRGVIAQAVSVDLVDWTPAAPFWDPRRFLMHECPDVFEWNGWWYLVFSEFSETFTTRYRMARHLDGPWLVPEYDSIDGRAFYAAKSVGLGGRRFFVGWIASRTGEQDDGEWLWAGTMSTLEAVQGADGTLDFGLPREVVDLFDAALPPALGDALTGPLIAPDGYASRVGDDDLPTTCLVRAELEIAPDTTEAGLLVRADGDGDRAYVLRLEPRRGRLVLDRWPRARTGPGQWQISGDVPFVLERPCALPPGRHVLEVVLDNDLLVAVLDGRTALSARVYDRPQGRLGVFVGEGSADVTSVTVHTPSDRTAPAPGTPPVRSTAR